MIDTTAFSDLPPVVWNIVECFGLWRDEKRRLAAFYHDCELGMCFTDRARVRKVITGKAATRNASGEIVAC